MPSDGSSTDGASRHPGVAAPGSAPGTPGSRPGARIRRGPSGFEAEFAAYLQERLRIALGVMRLAGAARFRVDQWLEASQPVWTGAGTAVATIAHAAGVAYCAVAWWVLRRRRLSPRALAVADVVTQAVVIGVFVLMYEVLYE